MNEQMYGWIGFFKPITGIFPSSMFIARPGGMTQVGNQLRNLQGIQYKAVWISNKIDFPKSVLTITSLNQKSDFCQPNLANLHGRFLVLFCPIEHAFAFKFTASPLANNQWCPGILCDDFLLRVNRHWPSSRGCIGKRFMCDTCVRIEDKN